MQQKMLLLQLQMMKDDGYQICRLYTDEIINKTAVHLYIKQGFKKDSDYKNHIITMSKSLDGTSPTPKWKGIPFGFVSESLL